VIAVVRRSREPERGTLHSVTVNMDTKSIYVLSVVEALCVAMEDHETGVSHVKGRVCVTTRGSGFDVACAKRSNSGSMRCMPMDC
jgi:hypothetical protein